jgi:hypothetical protein
MSYIYQDAIVKELSRGHRWKKHNISTMSISDIFDTYHDAYIKLKHSVTNEISFIKLSDLNTLVSNVTTTIQTFLTSNGNRTLPNLVSNATIIERDVMYLNVWTSMLDTVVPIKLGTHPDTDWNLEDCPDLLLSSKEPLNYNKVYENTLFSVNGLLHMSSKSDYGITLVNAATSKAICNRTELGAYSFEQCLDVPMELLNIDSSMLSNGTSSVFTDNCNLNIGRSLEGKTVFISMGGYLHALDDFCRIVNYDNGVLNLDFSTYPIMQRHYEMGNIIDTSSLVYEYNNGDKYHVVTDSIMKSDEYISSLVDLSQSFLIILEGNFFISKTRLEYTDLEGVYRSDVMLDVPCTSQRGLLKEYRTKEYIFGEGEEHFMVYVESTKLPNYMFETGTFLENLTCRNNLVPDKPYVRDSLNKFRIATSNLDIV